MLKLSIAFLASASLLSLSGCSYYFGDDDDDCYYGGAEADPYYEPEYLRNPESGQCEYFGGGGGGGCDDACGPCAETGTDSDGAAFYPSWAYCDGLCETLDEATCLETSACRGAYLDTPGGPSFWQCWGTDQSGPIQGGGCDGLDAYTCSLHDDCIAVHAADPGCGDPGGGAEAPEPCAGIGWFEYCADESTGCYSDAECGEGEHCNAYEVCLPPPGCDSGDADPGFVDCDAACYGYCVPDVEPDPGTCYGEVFCDSLPPECPADTTPGVKDGCWSGYCIPLAECEDPPPPIPCNEIGNEAQCVLREDCTAFYEGIDCVCDDLGNCECADWVFAECQ